MFTGIVERLAHVKSVRRSNDRNSLIQVDLGDEFSSTVKVGDSIAVNGTCLTVTAKRGGVVSCDVIEETLHRTNLGELSRGSKVNIERSLLLSDRVSGHLVTGHIDGTGEIAKVERQKDSSMKVWIDACRELPSLMVQKGSVAVDGVSLTLVDVTNHSFSFCLIPHTLANTTLGHKKPGDTVNIEADTIGKFVKKFLEEMSIKGDLKP